MYESITLSLPGQKELERQGRLKVAQDRRRVLAGPDFFVVKCRPQALRLDAETRAAPVGDSLVVLPGKPHEAARHEQVEAFYKAPECSVGAGTIRSMLRGSKHLLNFLVHASCLVPLDGAG